MSAGGIARADAVRECLWELGVGWEMGGARGGCGNHGDCSGNGFISAASGGGGAHGSQGVDGDAQVHKMADVLQVRFVEGCRHHHSGALLSCPGARGRFRMDSLDISRAFLVLS